MREGRLTAEYAHADASEEKIMSAATGQLERTHERDGRHPAGDRGRAAAAVSSRRLTERVFRIRESGIIAVLVVFVAITIGIEPRFARASRKFSSSWSTPPSSPCSRWARRW